MKQSDLDKIERYIQGLATDSEKEYIESFFLNGESNLYLRHTLEKEWNLSFSKPTLSEVNLSHSLDRIHTIIRKNEILNKKRPARNFVQTYWKTAAILLLPLLIGGGIVYSFMNNRINTVTDQKSGYTIHAPMGARISFNLPDGTTGMLNSGSQLSYSVPFNHRRHVILIGEAWFEVSHDEKHPFEISAGKSLVKVLGTSFNVNAYNPEEYVEVVLQSGKVEFLNPVEDVSISMVPSERLILKNGVVSKSITDPAKYSEWTQGKLVFRHDPMAEVVRRLEYWYNVKINLADRELEKYCFHATFQDDSLEDVIRYLCMSSHLNYTIMPGGLLENGTYKKGEVNIFLGKK